LYGAGTANNYLNGNLWVGTTSATGYKLGVSGATLLNGLVVFGTYGTGVGMYWDNANNSFGIGNTSPSAKIDVLGINLVNVKVKSNTNSGASIYQAANDLNNTNEFGMWGSTRGAFGAINSGDGFLYSNVSLALTSGVDMKFGTGATPNERMRLTAAGRLLLGTVTEGTFLLDVNGTARVSGQLTIPITTATTTGVSVTNSSSTGNPTFDITNNNSTLGFFRCYGTSFGTGTYTELSDIVGFGSTKSIKIFTDASSPTGGSNSIQFMAGGYNNNQERARIGTYGMLIGTKTSAASSILTLESITQGFLPPRMTNAQRTAISSPAVGLIVYCTDATEGLYVYKSTGWTFVI
jgi:hypothetical protein